MNTMKRRVSHRSRLWIVYVTLLCVVLLAPTAQANVAVQVLKKPSNLVQVMKLGPQIMTALGTLGTLWTLVNRYCGWNISPICAQSAKNEFLKTKRMTESEFHKLISVVYGACTNVATFGGLVPDFANNCKIVLQFLGKPPTLTRVVDRSRMTPNPPPPNAPKSDPPKFPPVGKSMTQGDKRDQFRVLFAKHKCDTPECKKEKEAALKDLGKLFTKIGQEPFWDVCNKSRGTSFTSENPCNNESWIGKGIRPYLPAETRVRAQQPPPTANASAQVKAKQGSSSGSASTSQEQRDGVQYVQHLIDDLDELKEKLQKNGKNVQVQKVNAFIAKLKSYTSTAKNSDIERYMIVGTLKDFLVPDTNRGKLFEYPKKLKGEIINKITTLSTKTKKDTDFYKILPPGEVVEFFFRILAYDESFSEYSNKSNENARKYYSEQHNFIIRQLELLIKPSAVQTKTQPPTPASIKTPSTLSPQLSASEESEILVLYKKEIITKIQKLNQENQQVAKTFKDAEREILEADSLKKLKKALINALKSDTKDPKYAHAQHEGKINEAIEDRINSLKTLQELKQKFPPEKFLFMLKVISDFKEIPNFSTEKTQAFTNLMNTYIPLMFNPGYVKKVPPIKDESPREQIKFAPLINTAFEPDQKMINEELDKPFVDPDDKTREWDPLSYAAESKLPDPVVMLQYTPTSSIDKLIVVNNSVTTQRIEPIMKKLLASGKIIGYRVLSYETQRNGTMLYIQYFYVDNKGNKITRIVVPVPPVHGYTQKYGVFVGNAENFNSLIFKNGTRLVFNTAEQVFELLGLDKTPTITFTSTPVKQPVKRPVKQPVYNNRL
jgi:hypothetical protein